MGYENIFAREQLMEVAKELTVELAEIKIQPLDDVVDQEHKVATKWALEHAVRKIHTKVDELSREYKK